MKERNVHVKIKTANADAMKVKNVLVVVRNNRNNGDLIWMMRLVH